MIKIKGRTVDDWGNVVFDSDGLIDHLMHGHDFTQDMVAYQKEGVEKFNSRCREFDHAEQQIGIYQEPSVSVEDFDSLYQSIWLLPDEYIDLDVQEWLFSKCSTEVEIERVTEELELFSQRELLQMLRCLIYLVDHFRKEKIVWGVGRGSSVASYCLFLIGIHKVDSLKFDLDIREFLK